MDGHPRQLKLAAAEIAKAQAPGHPGRPRRPPRRGLGRPRGVRREDPDPGGLDAARASAPSTRRIRWPTATWACTAGSTSTGRSSRADLLIAIGMRFDDRVTGNVRTYAPYARIIHVDIDPAEIGKNVAVEVPIVGDAKRVLAGADPARRPRSIRRRGPTTSPSWPSGRPTRSPRAGTARAPGATASCRPTTSSSGSAS